MDEKIKQYEEETNTNQTSEETPVDENAGGVAYTAQPKKQKFKFTKKKLIICGAILIALIIAAFALFYESEFEKVQNEACEIAGQIETGKKYFTIDTYPDTYENMDETSKMMLLSQAHKKALEAIKYVNEELDFNGSLYSKMISTTALMGRQTEENDKYKVSWTYHPNNGLEVTYEKK